MPPIRAPALSVLLVVLAGCGTQPVPPPDPLSVRKPGARMVQMRDPRTGLRFQAPASWVKRIRSTPGIFRIGSGAADVSGWAYFRNEPLPKTRAQLAAARDALVEEVKKRDASFQLTGSRLTEVQGNPAVELTGTQRIFGRVVATRSVHVYRGGEYVFEALAPPRDFPVTNERVLEPLLRSLQFAPLPGT